MQRQGFVSLLVVLMMVLGGCACWGDEEEVEGGSSSKMQENPVETSATNPCASGSNIDCTEALKGFVGDVAQQIEFAKVGCQRGFGDACFKMAFLHLKQEGGLEKDLALVEKYAQSGCDFGYAASCIIIPVLMNDGDMPEDPKRKWALMTAGCEGEDAYSCFVLGLDLIKNGNSEFNKGRISAETAFTRSCILGHQDACTLRERLKRTTAKPVVFKAAGIDWVVDGSIASRVQLKKVKCDSPLGDKKLCSLVVHYPEGWVLGQHGPIGVIAFDRDDVQSKVPSIAQPRIKAGATVRHKMLVEVVAKRVELSR